MLRLFLTAFFVTLLSCSSLAFTPEQTILNVQKAIDNCDPDAFEDCFSMDTILERGTDLLLNISKNQDIKDKSTLPPALMLFTITLRNDRMRSVMRPMIRDELKKSLRYCIASGMLTEHPRKDIPVEGMLSQFIAKQKTGPKKISLLGKAKKDHGNSKNRIVPSLLHDADTGQKYLILFHLIPDQNTWKIDDILNLETLLRTGKQ
ncbi:MAG: hypothetical protein PUB69_00310 [Desulfovibrionaceae bacterium]|nr:hypothetical protein [Desulfovibrionaceae bacterium]